MGEFYKDANKALGPPLSPTVAHVYERADLRVVCSVMNYAITSSLLR